MPKRRVSSPEHIKRVVRPVVAMQTEDACRCTGCRLSGLIGGAFPRLHCSSIASKPLELRQHNFAVRGAVAQATAAGAVPCPSSQVLQPGAFQ